NGSNRAKASDVQVLHRKHQFEVRFELKDQLHQQHGVQATRLEEVQIHIVHHYGQLFAQQDLDLLLASGPVGRRSWSAGECASAFDEFSDCRQAPKGIEADLTHRTFT